MRKVKNYLLDIFLLLFIVIWTFLLWIYGPDQIISFIGVRNGFILVFLTSLLGGVASLFIPLGYPTIIALAAGGLNPLAIGLIAGLGLTIANSIFFYLGDKGRNVAESSSRFKKLNISIIKWVNNRPEWLIPIFIFFYIGMTPFPNNILTASGGVIDYSFKRLVVPLFLGNLFLSTMVAMSGAWGLGLFV